MKYKKGNKMIRSEILGAWRCLEALAKMKLKTRLKFEIALNIKVLEPIVFAISEAQKEANNVEGFADLEWNIKKIFMKYAQDGRISNEADKHKYETEISEYQERPDIKKIVEELKDKKTEFDSFMKEEMEINGLNKIKLADLPDEMELDITPIISMIEKED